MSNLQAFHKAIEKVLSQGYKFPYQEHEIEKWEVSIKEGGLLLATVTYKTPSEGKYERFFKVNDIVLGKDFAKLFWGEGDIVNDYGFSGCKHTFFAWQYHLQQMVLEEDYLQYLARFL